jgi:DNA-binding transcriptional ArsR family regulator
MSAFADMKSTHHSDAIWQALADPVRRGILEFLTGQSRPTGEICDRFQKSARLSRTAVLRQLDLLIQADLVQVKPEGRQRINSLNPKPLEEICMPWLLARKQAWSDRLSRLKQHVESKQEKQE